MTLLHRTAVRARARKVQVSEDALDVLERHVEGILEVATVEAEKGERKRLTAAMMWRCVDGVK